MKKKIFILLYALVAMVTTANAQENMIDGHEYVDLGLPSGTLWATCRVHRSPKSMVPIMLGEKRLQEITIIGTFTSGANPRGTSLQNTVPIAVMATTASPTT